MEKAPGGWRGKGSRHERGYGTAWDRLRKLILQRDLHLCQPCQRNGRVTVATQVDHIKPKAAGGTDDEDNLQSICKPCHDVKTQREAEDAQGRKHRQTIGLDGWPVV